MVFSSIRHSTRVCGPPRFRGPSGGVGTWMRPRRACGGSMRRSNVGAVRPRWR